MPALTFLPPRKKDGGLFGETSALAKCWGSPPFAALGLLLMTSVIQLVVPDGWANFHLPSAAMAIAIIPLGPGLLSLDRLINR